jgi:cation diffusion facilitator CzcD-associated flavoprotein CzcO
MNDIAEPRPAADLAALEREVARDLERLLLPPASWPARVPGPDGREMLDVLVIGAGMCGIAAAAALIFKGVSNIEVVDRSADGLEGPWVTFARMAFLRSPKHLPGPVQTVPSLTFRAWYEARHGCEGWEALYKIPNADWQDYLTWLKRVLRLPVRNGTDVLRIAPAGDALAVTLRDAAGRHLQYARRVVMATGRSGTGGLLVPAFVDAALWPDRAAHSAEPIDFELLAGRHIAVLGAGASAWDNASTALERGAARVDIYARRRTLPQINKGRGSSNPGFFEGWGALEPAERWRLLVYLHDVQSPPPHESVHRALRHPGFTLHLGWPVRRAVADGEGVALTLGPDGDTAKADFLICATGFAVDLRNVPELEDLVPHAATWADRHVPPEALRRPELGKYPWLGPAFEMTEKEPGSCPAVGRVHLFNHAAMASLGAVASDIPGVNVGAERLSSRIAQALFREDIAHMRAELEAFAEPELESTPFFAL